MKERIKRVDKGFWILAVLWLVSMEHVSTLSIVAGAVMLDYLVWKMRGAKA